MNKNRNGSIKKDFGLQTYQKDKPKQEKEAPPAQSQGGKDDNSRGSGSTPERPASK